MSPFFTLPGCIALKPNGLPSGRLREPVVLAELLLGQPVDVLPHRGSIRAGLALVGAGFLLYLFRHRPDLGQGVAEAASGAISSVTTPLARAMRHSPFG